MSAPVFVLAVALAVVLVGLLAAIVTWAFHPAPTTPCSRGCRPPGGRASQTFPAADEKTYGSSFGWAFDYPADWQSETSDLPGDWQGVTFGGDSWGATIAGSTTGTVPGGLFLGAGLWAELLTGTSSLGTIAGAHVGSQEGQGQLYEGTFVTQPGAGRAKVMRAAVVAATHGGTTVALSAFDPYDRSDAQEGGRGISEDFDALLTEFRWPGER